MTESVVEIKQRLVHKAKFETRVTLEMRILLVLRQNAQPWRYWLIGNWVVYLTRRNTNVELAERTAACLRICEFRNVL